MTRSIKTFKISFRLMIGGALAVAALWLLVPTPKGATADYTPLAVVITLFDMVIAGCGAALFLVALRSFRAELKPAYRLIAFAQLSISLGVLVTPVTVLYNLWGSPLFNTLSYMGYFTASILMFLGTRKFAGILGIKSHARSVMLVIGLGVAAWIGHAFLPHVAPLTDVDELSYDLFEFIPTLPIFAYGAAWYLTGRMSQRVGLGYKKAFEWLNIGLGVQLVAALLTAVMEVVGYNNWVYNSALYALPIIAGDLCLLVAAYRFNIIGLPYGAISRRTQKGREATSLDIITYAAGLASDPTEIDPLLDKIRTFSAGLKPGETPTFSDSDQLMMRDVYLGIEQYLMHEDSLRFFGQTELRNSISSVVLGDRGAEHTFWPLLKTS